MLALTGQRIRSRGHRVASSAKRFGLARLGLGSSGGKGPGLGFGGLRAIFGVQTKKPVGIKVVVRT